MVRYAAGGHQKRNDSYSPASDPRQSSGLWGLEASGFYGTSMGLACGLGESGLLFACRLPCTAKDITTEVGGTRGLVAVRFSKGLNQCK